MNKFLLLITFSIFCFSTSIAQIAVKSFRILPTDQTARITDPMIDQNGEKCALIKVVTTETGFGWEGGMLGITKVEPKLGEFWVYVPHGAKKITIKHGELGILRNYIYTEAIYEAMVYEMVLITGIVRTIVEKPEIESVWLMVNSTPSKSDLYIDDTYVGQTPFQKKLKKQKYNFRLSKVKYQPNAGVVDLTNIDDKKLLDINLKPDFGSVYITTEPENGATVILDDINISKTTPCTINEVKSGTHRITLRREWYEPVIKEFSLTAEEEKTINVQLTPSFGELNIYTEPRADIYIDNQKKGYGQYSCRLSPGIYSIKVQKPKHHDDTQSIEIIVGDVKNINLNVTPQYGILDIASTPWDANISIENKNYGKTPKTIKDILVGTYTVKLTKEGYISITKTITIEEGQTEEINEELSSGKQVTIKSKPQGAKLYIDNTYKGITPYTGELAFGQHRIKFIKDEYEELSQNIDITETTVNPNLTLKRFSKQITINSSPQGAKLYIDNEYKGTTPQTLSLSFESHSFKLEKDKYKDYQSTKTIANGTNSLSFEIMPANSGNFTDTRDRQSYKFGSFTDARDRQSYKWVRIGTQIWMAENLNYLTENSWCYDNKKANCDKYGRLYNWDAAMRTCPNGWHLPSDDEWNILVNYIGGTGISGKKLKSSSGWADNGNGTNSNDFEARPGGARGSDGSFGRLTYDAFFWSSSESNYGSAWYRILFYYFDGAHRGNNPKAQGFSIRCVKD